MRFGHCDPQLTTRLTKGDYNTLCSVVKCRTSPLHKLIREIKRLESLRKTLLKSSELLSTVGMGRLSNLDYI
jgi:hypothetical protein